MNTSPPLRKLSQPPEWVTQWFEEIDSKRFGPAFDDCFTDDVEMIFGVDHIHGFAAVKAHLMKFDSTMDTKHMVIDFWDAGNIKFLRGEVRMTPYKSPEKTVTPTFVHVWYMSEQEPQRLQRIHGAVGPTGA